MKISSNDAMGASESQWRGKPFDRARARDSTNGTVLQFTSTREKLGGLDMAKILLLRTGVFTI